MFHESGLSFFENLIIFRMRELDLKEWRKDAAEILISKLGVCARCVLCICGYRSAQLFALSEPDLRERIRNLVGLSAEDSTELKTCSMCLGILSHSESQETLNAISSAISQVGYDTSSVSAYMLSLSMPASVCIRQHMVCLHLHELLRHKAGSEVICFLEHNQLESNAREYAELKDIGGCCRLQWDDDFGRI